MHEAMVTIEWADGTEQSYRGTEDYIKGAMEIAHDVLKRTPMSVTVEKATAE